LIFTAGSQTPGALVRPLLCSVKSVFYLYLHSLEAR
jgi:hypothetical protein